MSHSLPNPVDRPLLRIDELVGIIPGMRRTAIYDAVRRGDIPSVRVGSRLFIPNAALRRAWMLDPVGPDDLSPAPVVEAELDRARRKRGAA